jgi:hypothetical protein
LVLHMDAPTPPREPTQHMVAASSSCRIDTMGGAHDGSGAGSS